MSLPRWQLFLGTIIVVTTLNWAFFAGAEAARLVDARAAFHVAEQRLIDGQGKANALNQVRHQLELLEQRSGAVPRRLPHEPALDELEKGLREFASASFLRGVVLERRPETSPWLLAQLPKEAPLQTFALVLKATGSSLQFGYFLDTLRRLQRLVVVTRFELANPHPRGGRTVVDGTVELVAFQSNFEPRPPEPLPLAPPPEFTPLEALLAELPAPLPLPPPPPPSAVEPLDLPATPAAAVFDPTSVRDAFHPPNATLFAGDPSPLPAGACANARPLRPAGPDAADPLDLFELDQLHLVAVKIDSTECALIRDPTGACHDRRFDEPFGTGRSIDDVDRAGIVVLRETFTDPDGTRLFPTLVRMKVAPGGRAPASFCSGD